MGICAGRRLLAVLAAAAFAVSGCSTVIKTSTGEEQGRSAERAALEAAAADLAAAPWPKPSSSSITEILAGQAAPGARISRGDAVDAYVATLASAADAQAALFFDAARHLEAAGALRNAAEIACGSARPRFSDVALVEAAIADLGETRAIYVSSMKKIDADDDSVAKLKRDFDGAIKALGAAADQLADSAMKRRTQNFAGPRVAGAAGSL